MKVYCDLDQVGGSAVLPTQYSSPSTGSTAANAYAQVLGGAMPGNGGTSSVEITWWLTDASSGLTRGQGRLSARVSVEGTGTPRFVLTGTGGVEYPQDYLAWHIKDLTTYWELWFKMQDAPDTVLSYTSQEATPDIVHNTSVDPLRWFDGDEHMVVAHSTSLGGTPSYRTAVADIGDADKYCLVAELPVPGAGESVSFELDWALLGTASAGGGHLTLSVGCAPLTSSYTYDLSCTGSQNLPAIDYQAWFLVSSVGHLYLYYKFVSAAHAWLSYTPRTIMRGASFYYRENYPSPFSSTLTSTVASCWLRKGAKNTVKGAVSQGADYTLTLGCAAYLFLDSAVSHTVTLQSPLDGEQVHIAHKGGAALTLAIAVPGGSLGYYTVSGPSGGTLAYGESALCTAVGGDSWIINKL